MSTSAADGTRDLREATETVHPGVVSVLLGTAAVVFGFAAVLHLSEAYAALGDGTNTAAVNVGAFVVYFQLLAVFGLLSIVADKREAVRCARMRAIESVTIGCGRHPD